MRCPKCGADLPPQAKFCLECGARVADTTTESERRIVTVLFCDVKGSTTLAESMDPEAWTEIMNGAFEGLIPPVTRYDGTVMRLLGDAVLAFFGAPTAHEDDPERAVLAGLEMLQALATYRERLVRERGLSEFDVRIGINTGLAVVGGVGSGQRVDYTAMGDAVNIAARLQAAARPGTIVVGGTTQRAVASVFDLAPLGEIQLKGRADPVHAFEVVGLAAGHGERRGIPGQRAPVVGRDREVRELTGVLDELRSGHGRIVSLIGEPGIGKSRLIDEMRSLWRDATDGRARWSDSVCESYAAAQAYLALRPVLMDLVAMASITPSSPVLLGLLGRGDLAAVGLEGEALAAAIREEMASAITAAASEPLVLAFDDLHWADPASGDVLAELFALTDELPLLFLLGFRPDRKTVGWRLKQSAEADLPHRYRETMLAPLGPDDGASLIDRVLGPNELPQALRKMVATKADGNPFFLEEIIRTLIDRRVVRKDHTGIWRAPAGALDVPLPDTLQSLLAARIDRLDEPARHTLQAASVIGRTFPYGILAAVAQANGRLDKDLGTLQRFELVIETAKIPERQFIFRHALTQDAAYASMLQRRRRELHVKVAEALIAERGEAFSDEDAGIAGIHFAQAADPRAAALLVRAGDHARRVYALDEALAYYDRALAQAASAEPSLLLRLFAGRGRTFELRGDHDAAIANYEDLRRAAAERGDRAIEGNALAMLATIYSTATARRDAAKATALLEHAIAIAREADDRVLIAKLQESRMWVAYFSGELDSALEAGEEAVAIDRTLVREEQLPFALNNVSHVYRDLCRFADAEAAGGEATQRFRALNNKSMVADSLSTRLQALVATGDYERVLAFSVEARLLSEEARNEWGISYADYIAPWVVCERGDLGSAIEGFRNCLEHARLGGFGAAEVGSQAELAGIFRDIGAYELARSHLGAALDASRRFLPSWQVWPLAHLARLHLAAGEMEAARRAVSDIDAMVDAFDTFAPIIAQTALARASLAMAEGRTSDARSIAADRRRAFELCGVRAWLPDLALLEGDIQARAGEPDAARHAYEVARDLAEQVGSRRMLWRIYAALGERERAREIAASIAASLERVGLRTAFEALPEVRALA